MTPNPQNADKFDVEEVEKALSEISPWPWFFKDEKYQGSGAVYPNVITSTLHAIAHISSGFTYEYKINSNESERRDALNGLFISKSPQRLAAAVERIRELERGISRWCGSTEIRDLNIFMENLFDRIESLKKRHAEGCECPGCRNKLQMKLQGRF